ncbi:phage tail tape measure protein [Cupriavidus oxalaticus]|uniref:Phage tail tape measure protein n=1 Tax=Cupriavidus oxalaticus TaxID=96344 RepID=A0A5P3VPK6_9BURK|nr:phage tail tape measure protein [Cupriavidus oxalaticus]QEZ47181.1 phage tail tape measure protein [Cupriavidus oxalaticus]
MADETVVRVTADASGYKAELDKARSSADAFIAKQEEAARRTKASQDAIAEAAKNGSDASARSINAFVQQVARMSDAAGKTRTQLLEQKAAQLGVTGAVSDYINKLKEVERNAGGGKKVQEALNGVTMSAQQTAAAMRAVPAQMTDIVTQLAGGQSPLLILTQQGGQLKDMFGGVVPAVRALGTYVVGLINPITLTAAAAAAMGYAFYAGNKEAKELSNTLALTGNYAAQTTTSFHGLARQVAADANSSFGDARDVLLDLTRTGRYTSSEMEGLAAVILRTSQKSGEALQDVSKDYAKLAEDPAKWAAEHNQSMHFMDVATYQHITALQEAGDKHAAVQAVIEAATKQVADSTTKNLGVAAQAWRDLGNGVSQFWEEVKKGLSTGPTLQDRIDTLMGERSGIQGNALASRRVAAIDQQVAMLQEQQRMEQRAAESSAANARRQEQAIAAQQRVDKMADSVMSNAQRRQKELEKLQKDREAILAAGGEFSDEDYANLVAGVNAKYKDPKTAKARQPKAYQDDAATRFIQQLRDQDAATRAALESAEKLTGAEKQQAEFLQKISDLKGKAILTAEQKSLLANQDQIKAQLAQNVENERALKLKTDIQKVEERSAAVSAQIGNMQRSHAEQYQRQLDAMGRGTEAQKQAEAVRSIYRAYEQLQLQLEKATPEAARNSAAYIQAQEGIRNGLDQSLQDYDAYYSALREKQESWLNGATEAVANYAEASRNRMAQTSAAVNSVFKGMEDGIVQFATTGKLNFGNFAQAVIADLIRIQARAALSGIFSQLGGLVVGAMGGSMQSSFGGLQGSTDFAGTPVDMSSVAGIEMRATGGHVNAGQPYWVGEVGPEVFVPTGSGSVLSNDTVSSAGAVGGGNVTIIQHIKVDSRSDQASIMQAMVQAKNAAVAEVKQNLARGGDMRQLAGR